MNLRQDPHAPPPFATLRLDAISRWFGRVPALRELTIEVARGEFVALLGPSGCGKSTTLACLAGLQPLTSGTIWRDEERIDTLPAERRGFGMVFQNYALFPHLTVQRNVEFGLAMRRAGRAERQAKAREALRTVRLEEHGGKRPAQLSGGQQQRVAIARALAFEPQIVLMDEPLSNLDAGLRVDLRAEIKRLHESLGLTTVYVTHDQSEALSLATKIVVMKDGCAEQVGPPEELYRAPSSAYVARFMGYRNTVQGTVRSVTADGVLVDFGGQSVLGTFMSPGAPAPGRRVVVALHPEDLVPGGAAPRPVQDSAAPGAPAGRVDASVEVIEYHGRTTQVVARTADGTALRVQTDRPLHRGEPVHLYIRADRALVYSDDGDAGELDALAEQVA
ncbi:ABC transporter ATP-binding protein [Streptomyces sulfonofaciens]|uniref:ABC transporter ATP-binding protein n=1 Tax=Streptomyces sulfonofaciens TaxID=68272 RepID=A0A919L2W3_9ACTN|nr:ABC transporter ATP-binding protein [Streptomyces sulfonofaciens]GHH81928.1 ABC transporter ATP-binding protein [Streptomyces sulfonofaciens]